MRGLMTGTVDARHTTDEYFGLVDAGALHPDDRTELLEGVIVAVAPQNPPHAATVGLVADALRRTLASRATVRVQAPLVLGQQSVPEPDVAVVRGRHADYWQTHPKTALLVVEVAERSLPQDRLTKSRTYAAAGIPEYWIVDLRDDCVEAYCDPDVSAAAYRLCHVARRGDKLSLAAIPDAVVTVNDLLPDREPADS